MQIQLSNRRQPCGGASAVLRPSPVVAQAVQRFGGFVAKYMGDGVLIYFGYPRAHEDDAERAVRAGLELISAVGGVKSGAVLQTRVGATGLVVIGHGKCEKRPRPRHPGWLIGGSRGPEGWVAAASISACLPAGRGNWYCGFWPRTRRFPLLLGAKGRVPKQAGRPPTPS
jgi:hypothetical protein